MGSEKAAALLDFSCTDVKPNDPMPFSYGFKADDYRRLCAVADTLHVSLDYLFLRDDIPDRRQMLVSETDTTPGWRTGEPPRDGRYLCRLKYAGKANGFPEQQYIRRGKTWVTSYGKPIPSVITVVGWWPIPPKE